MVNKLHRTLVPVKKNEKSIGTQKKIIRKKLQKSICSNKSIHIKKDIAHIHGLYICLGIEMSRRTNNILLKFFKNYERGPGPHFYFIRFNIDNKLIFQNFSF